MDNDFTSAAGLFAGSQGAVFTGFQIFATLYSAVFSPIQGAMGSVSGNLASSTAALVKVGVVAALMLWAAVTALRHPDTPLFGEMITRVFAPAAVTLYILSSQYQVIVQALLNQVNTWSNDMVGGLGGSTITGGAPFDLLLNHSYAAGLAVENMGYGGLTGLGIFILICIYWFVTGAAIAFAFVLFLVSQISLYVLFTIGPIFIGFGAFTFTRFLLKGMVSAVSSVICTQVIVMALLALAYTVEQSILAPVWSPGGGGQPANANIWGSIETLIQVAIVLVALTIAAFKASAYAVGICGGIFDGIAPWVTAGMVAARGFGGGVAGAASAMPVSQAFARPAMAVAGRMNGP